MRMSTVRVFATTALLLITGTYLFAQSSIPPPEFSKPPGYYSSDFTLHLEHPDPDARIYYTRDGSVPGDTSRLYSESDSISIRDRNQDPNNLSIIPTNHITSGIRRWISPEGLVSKGTTVRARAFVAGVESETVTATYFVSGERFPFDTLPVLSITTDSLNLFGYKDGIYVPGINYTGSDGSGNYVGRKIEWERPASLEWFDHAGNLEFQQDIGIRIHGGFSRRFAQKSLRLYARSDYGENRFYYSVFPEQEYENYNRLLLRNSGNDFSFTMFMDAAAQSLVRHFNVDTQAYRPALLYLNGEFWGIKNLRERYDRHYLSRVYGLDEENVDILTRRNTVKEGSNDHYNAMVSFIEKNDLSDPANFDSVATLMDIDNFLDYYSAEIYYGNNDWPHNNIDFWRYDAPYNPNAPKGQDGRWRWLLYDVDRSLGYSTYADYDMIEWVTAPKNFRNNQKWPNLILRNLLDNEQFYYDFINRLSDHLNTAFLPDRVRSVIDSLRLPLEPVIDAHIARWPNHQSRANWENWVQRMFTYADERPDYMRQHMMDHFDLGEQVTLAVDVSHSDEGHVQVNSIDILASLPGVGSDPYSWSGIYFSDIPVRLTAHPREGYAFSHWESDADLPGSPNLQNPEITVQPERSVTLTAHFEPATSGPDDREVVHYWFFSNELPNDTPLVQIPPVYSQAPGAKLVYRAAIQPYPPNGDTTDGIMDRVNDPTDIHYISTLTGDAPFFDSDMRGIRVRNPSLVDDRESSVVLHIPTTGYEAPELRFAAVRTGNGQRELRFEYSTDSDGESWTDEGLGKRSAIMYEAYKSITVSFSGIEGAEDNPDLKFRIRFDGDEDIRTGTNGNVRFNNVVLYGTAGNQARGDGTVIVWPGDTNNSGSVDGGDLLPVGVYHLQSRSGEVRDSENNTGTDWEPHERQAWSADGGTPARVYADANGDGIIDSRDVLVIARNYGKTWDDASDRPIVTADLSARGVQSAGGRSGDAKLSGDTKLSDSGKPSGDAKPSGDGAGSGTSSAETTDYSGELAISVVGDHHEEGKLRLAVDGGSADAPVYGLSLKLHVEGAVGSLLDYELFDEMSDLGEDLLAFSMHPEDSSFIDIALSNTGGDGFSGDGRLITLDVMHDFTSGDKVSVYLQDVMALRADGGAVALKPDSLAFTIGREASSGAAPDEVPDAFQLGSNYPNPFNPATQITYGLPRSEQVHLAVYDLLGRQVATLVNARRDAGYHTVSFDAGHLASGVYIYRITAGEFVETRSMMLVK